MDILLKNHFGKTSSFYLLQGILLTLNACQPFMSISLFAMSSEKIVKKLLISSKLISAASYSVVAFSFLSLSLLDMD